jgi:hypothetical protein
MVALHGKRLHSRCIITANVAHETIDNFQTRRGSDILTKTSFLQDLLLLVHVLLNQTLLVPAHIAHEDGCRFMWLTENVGDLFYLPILLVLDVLRAVDGEVDLIWLLAGFEILILRLKANVAVVV